MDNFESIAKAAVEKLKEMNMVENTKEMVKKSTPFVKTSFDWLLQNATEIMAKTTPLLTTSFDWFLEKASPMIYTAQNWVQKAPLSYTISIGFVLFLLLLRCCSGGRGGGSGKTMKAPGRNNVRITRSSFESSPKAYFRNLRSK